MPNTIQTSAYEMFDFKQPEEKPLSLGEAIEEVSRRRAAGDRMYVYRLVETGRGRRRFRIVVVPREKAETELLERISKRWVRLLSHYRSPASR